MHHSECTLKKSSVCSERGSLGKRKMMCRIGHIVERHPTPKKNKHMFIWKCRIINENMLGKKTLT